MRKSLLISCLSLVFVIALSGCQKEGCTDANAVNFDSEATKDNSTCTYESTLTFWYGEETANNLGGLFGTSTLTYYVDGAIIGSSAANVYFTAAPECGSQGTVSITKDLGIAKNKTYSYKVLNDSGSEIWEGTHNFEANSCTAIELTF